jgi:L-lactate dehydrogenase complex protein LldE
MLTCLADTFYGEVGIATVRVLEALGHRVIFPADQTCCGQPPFNAGDWATARKVATHCLTCFSGADVVVTPSASCAAMIRHGYGELFPHRSPGLPCYELSEFLAEIAPFAAWPAVGIPKVGLHVACHGRIIGLGSKTHAVLSRIEGLEVIDSENPEQCCGFGGAFAVSHGKISEGIGLEKLRTMPPYPIVSTDLGCLMHLHGLANRNGVAFDSMHLAQLLARGLGKSP